MKYYSIATSADMSAEPQEGPADVSNPPNGKGKPDTSKRRTRKPFVIPTTPKPAAMWGKIFETTDLAGILLFTELELQSSANAEMIAERLDRLLMDFTLSCIGLESATPMQCAAWCREAELRRLSFLDCFSMADDGSDPLDAAGRLLRGPGGYMELSGVLINPRDVIAAAMLAMENLRRLVTAAAEQYEHVDKTKREFPAIELTLFQRLGEIYRDAFGAGWTFNRDAQGQPVGPAIRFCQAIGNHLKTARPDLLGPGGRPQMKAAIDRLYHPHRAADRIRDAVGGSPRKR